MEKEYKDHLGNIYISLKEMYKHYGLTTSTYYQRRRKGWSLEKTLTTPLMRQCGTSHIGEKRLNNDGLEMTIIDAFDSHHLTIKFTKSGNIFKNRYYGDFCSGKIKDKIIVEPDKIIGEKRMMNCGSICEIINYKKNKKHRHTVTVKFENGYIKTTAYIRYLQGEIDDGTKKSIKKSLVGDFRIAKNGEKYTVISEDKTHCIIRFENNVEKQYSRNNVLHNVVNSHRTSPAISETGEYIGVYSKGKVLISKGKRHYTIIECYKNGKYIDVKDEDGAIEYHIKPSTILKRKEFKKVIQKRVNAVIGEKSLTTSLNECEIIGGTKLDDLDVLLEDGSVLHNQKYYRFKNGLINEKGVVNTVIEKTRYKYIGKTVLQSCGLDAVCVEYNNYNDITVEFSDGTRRKTNTIHFNRGNVTYNPNIKKGSLSFNEYTLQQCLKNAGFIKMPCGSLKDLDEFKNKELDIYNPKYKIAIEYDGYFHKHEQAIKNDNDKDRLCKKHGITIYRVREKNVPLLNNGISIEYILKDNHAFNPDLRNIIKCIAEDISLKVGININIPDLQNKDIQNEIIRNFAKNGSFLSRIGEVRYNLQGEKMQIFEYWGSKKVGIIFDNGYTTWRSYNVFKKGNIRCLYNHYGEESVSLSGQKMQVISNNYGNRVDIQFEDNTIVKNQLYSNFIKGSVTNPNYKHKQPNYKHKKDFQLGKMVRKPYNDSHHIGEVVQTSCGLLAEIIEVKRIKTSNCRNILKVIARFEDGAISSETRYHHFLKGYVKHPNIRFMPDTWHKKIAKRSNNKIQNYREKVMNQHYFSADGYNFDIIDYQGYKHIRIRFEDGFELNSSMDKVQPMKIKRYLSKNIKRNIG